MLIIYTLFVGSYRVKSEKSKGPGFYLDDFGALVMSKTMYSALPQKYQNNTRVMSRHNNMINFTVENISDSSIPSPKFVYVHLMLPHPPFMFSSDGAMESGHFTDWNYYLDNYIYSIKVTKQMVNNILQNADPENPPVIILQSDHGARNESTVESIFLPDYPEKFKTLILYSLYIPGYDYSTLPQNINPVNTFPIVFNHIFITDIPLLK